MGLGNKEEGLLFHAYPVSQRPQALQNSQERKAFGCWALAS
jgi:hypothetical protein